MIGLGLRHLQDTFNRKADTVQREFIAVSDRLRAIGLKLVESREADHDRLLVEQQELRQKQLVIAETVNQWRERAREVVNRGDDRDLREYLTNLLELDDPNVRAAVEHTLRLLDAPDEAGQMPGASVELPYEQASPAARLLARARNEYDLRGSDPAPRQRAAVEFANRPGLSQDENLIAQLEAGLDDPDPIVREVATLTLVQIHRFRAMNLADLDAAHESVKRLAKIDHLAAVQPLIEVLSTPRSGFSQGQEERNSSSRMVALTRLIEWHTAAAQSAIQARRFDQDPGIFRVAMRALELFPGEWSGPLRRGQPVAGGEVR
jgi:hypothetical protein